MGRTFKLLEIDRFMSWLLPERERLAARELDLIIITSIFNAHGMTLADK